MKEPLVSVIVPTKNSKLFIESCLKSIQGQTYQNIEIILIDNFSTDDTKEIAGKFTKQIFEKGPERSTQRNFGVSQASGKYVAIIDSDMELSPSVIEECVNKIERDSSLVGIVIPEESFGIGFWAQCKKLEKSFYNGVSWIEAARFFPKEAYKKVGGYDEEMVSGEDWDLSQRIQKFGQIGRIGSLIHHNEGKISLFRTIRKKYYYAQKYSKYLAKNKSTLNSRSQNSVIARYKLYFSDTKKLFKNPLTGLGMLFMKTAELFFGGIAILMVRFKSK